MCTLHQLRFLTSKIITRSPFNNKYCYPCFFTNKTACIITDLNHIYTFIHISIAFYLLNNVSVAGSNNVITMPLRKSMFTKGPRICMIGHDSSSLSSGNTLDFSSPVGWRRFRWHFFRRSSLWWCPQVLCKDRTMVYNKLRWIKLISQIKIQPKWWNNIILPNKMTR